MQINFKDICGNSISLQLQGGATVLFACECLSQQLNISANQILLISPNKKRNFYSNTQLIQEVIKENQGFIAFTTFFKIKQNDFLQKNSNTLSNFSHKNNDFFFEYQKSIKSFISLKNINFNKNLIHKDYSECINNAPDDYQQKIDEIMALGYEIEDIKEALRKYNYNVVFALNYLVQHNLNDNDSSNRTNHHSNIPKITSNSINRIPYNSNNHILYGNNNNSFTKRTASINKNGIIYKFNNSKIDNNSSENNNDNQKTSNFNMNIDNDEHNFNDSNNNDSKNIDNKIDGENGIIRSNFKSVNNNNLINFRDCNNLKDLWNKKPSVWCSNNQFVQQKKSGVYSPQKQTSWNFEMANNIKLHSWSPSKNIKFMKPPKLSTESNPNCQNKK